MVISSLKLISSCLGDECLHYTQVVWRDSVYLGCAKVNCYNGGSFVICSYDPPGNYEGDRPYWTLRRWIHLHGPMSFWECRFMLRILSFSSDICIYVHCNFEALDLIAQCTVSCDLCFVSFRLWFFSLELLFFFLNYDVRYFAK